MILKRFTAPLMEMTAAQTVPDRQLARILVRMKKAPQGAAVLDGQCAWWADEVGSVETEPAYRHRGNH